jgi:hypothetical protein
MRRLVSAIAFGLALVLMLAGRNHAADAPSYVGTWRVVLLTLDQEIPLFVVKAAEKEDKPTIEILESTPQFKGSTIKDVKATGGKLQFTAKGRVTFLFTFNTPKRENKGKDSLGVAKVTNTTFFARLEPTENKEVGNSKPAEGVQDYFKAAFEKPDPKEKETLLKEVLSKHEDDVLGYYTNLLLLDVMPGNGAKPDDIKTTAEKVIKFAAPYGDEGKAFAIQQITKTLVASKKAPELALVYAREAEKMLPRDATPTQTMAVLKPLLSALKQADRKEEIKGVAERVAGLEKALDEEFEKTAVPFKTEPYTRAAAKNRTVLLELFTGAQCPPCVAADVAFDAALQTYKPQDVILLQYHEHIPGPDPLTNSDTETRFKYYKGRGVPTLVLNGSKPLPLGGSKEMGEKSFEVLTDALKESLDSEEQAKIKLTAEKTGDNVVIKANVSDLKDVGEDTKLRFALVEDVVRYAGGNGQRFHHHVVRSMPGGVEGFPLKEAKSKQEVKVNLADVKKELADYLTKTEKILKFPNDDRPLDLKNLKVVAFIQNDKTKEILQAAQVDVK